MILSFNSLFHVKVRDNEITQVSSTQVKPHNTLSSIVFNFENKVSIFPFHSPSTTDSYHISVVQTTWSEGNEITPRKKCFFSSKKEILSNKGNPNTFIVLFFVYTDYYPTLPCLILVWLKKSEIALSQNLIS